MFAWLLVIPALSSWSTPAHSAKIPGSTCEISEKPARAELHVGQSYQPRPISWRCPVEDVLASATIDYGNGTERSCALSKEFFNKQTVTVTATCEAALYQKLLSREVTVTTPHAHLNLSWSVVVSARK